MGEKKRICSSQFSYGKKKGDVRSQQPIAFLLVIFASYKTIKGSLTSTHAGVAIGFPAESLANGHPPLNTLGVSVPNSRFLTLEIMIATFKNSIQAAPSLQSSRIWPIFSCISLTVLHSLRGHPSANSGHLAAIPFFSLASLAYEHPPPTYAGQCFVM